MPSDTQFQRYLHSNLRLKARYGIEVTMEEYLELCDKIQSGEGIGTKTAYDGHNKEVWLQVKGQWVCAQYKTNERLICTFLPAPPPNLYNEQFQQFKENLTKDNARKINVAVRKKLVKEEAPADPTMALYKQDITFLKDRVRDIVRILVEEKNLHEAVCQLDALTKVPLKQLPYTSEEAQKNMKDSVEINRRILKI